MVWVLLGQRRYCWCPVVRSQRSCDTSYNAEHAPRSRISSLKQRQWGAEVSDWCYPSTCPDQRGSGTCRRDRDSITVEDRDIQTQVLPPKTYIQRLGAGDQFWSKQCCWCYHLRLPAPLPAHGKAHPPVLDGSVSCFVQLHVSQGSICHFRDVLQGRINVPCFHFSTLKRREGTWQERREKHKIKRTCYPHPVALGKGNTEQTQHISNNM